MQNEAAELEEKSIQVLIQSNDIDPLLIQDIENQSAIITQMEMPANLTTLADPGNNTEQLRSLAYDAILRIEQRN